ncbi:MAG: hypothetical protein ACOC9Y_03765 [Chloroflexota bacterium]
MGDLDRRQVTLQRFFRWVAIATFILTAVQPVLGGFGTYRPADDFDYTAVHGMIANILFPLALVLFGLAFVAGFKQRFVMGAWTFGLLALVVSQIGIGYSARNDVQLLAYHIPAGVAIFGIALMVMLIAIGVRFERDSA